MSTLLAAIRPAGLALSLALCAVAAPAASYRVTLIDDSPVSHGYINEAGDIAGTSWIDGNYRAYLYRNGVRTVYDGLGGVEAMALGIGPDGAVLGAASDANEDSHAVVWTSSTPTKLKGRGDFGSVVAVNQAGVHVGTIWRDERPHALRWSRKGRPSSLVASHGVESYAAAINQAGVIVGAAAVAHSGEYHAFRLDSSGLQDLGTLVAGQASYATAINRHGDIVGSADLADSASHAVRFTDAGIVDLGTLGGDISVAWALNDLGDVVGESSFDHPERPWHTRAFLVHDGRMQSLQALLRPEDRALWHLNSAHSINNAGQIVASAHLAGSRFWETKLVRLDPLD